MKGILGETFHEILDMKLFQQFIDRIATLPCRTLYSRQEICIPELRLYHSGSLEIYYAPFDHVRSAAKIAIVGITPGWTQMQVAYRVARNNLHHEFSSERICELAKAEASFAGSMRKNLVQMLDSLGLPELLGLDNCAQLFNGHSHLLHTTSAVRYPTFVNGQNYTGHSPDLLSTPVLKQYIEAVLAPELQETAEALIVPLGKCVENVLRHLNDRNLLKPERCLFGFPHPSGANGHRVAHFEMSRGQMVRTLTAWFGSACRVVECADYV